MLNLNSWADLKGNNLYQRHPNKRTTPELWILEYPIDTDDDLLVCLRHLMSVDFLEMLLLPQVPLQQPKTQSVYCAHMLNRLLGFIYFVPLTVVSILEVAIFWYRN